MSEDRYHAAARRADQRIGFVLHALAFVIVNLALAANLGFRPEAGYVWGWGLGLAAHGLVVLGPGAALREHLIARELARDEQH